MTTTYSDNEHRDLELLNKISADPDATQATLAAQLGVAVGTINWHLKRLIEKGYVKVRRAERRKLKYIITPEGISLRAKLAIDYIQSSMSLYRLVRERSVKAINEVQNAGFSRIRLLGEGDVAEICRLTCLENNLELVENGDHYPVLKINELKVYVLFEEEQYNG